MANKKSTLYNYKTPRDYDVFNMGNPASPPFKMKGHTLPGINQKSEGGTDLPDGKSKSSTFQYFKAVVPPVQTTPTTPTTPKMTQGPNVPHPSEITVGPPIAGTGGYIKEKVSKAKSILMPYYKKIKKSLRKVKTKFKQ